MHLRMSDRLTISKKKTPYLIISGCTKSAETRIQKDPKATAGIGRVEVYLNSTWGTVCKEPYWDVLESKVACASQCFPASEVNHDVIAGSGPIVIGNVQCSGDERTLQNCTYSKPDTSFCGHYMDAGVKCFESKLSVKFETNTVLTFNSSTKCVGIPSKIHDRMPDYHQIS